MSARRFTDEDLTAYLDGEASPELRAAIDEALLHDPALAEALKALEFPMERLRSEADALADAVPEYATPVSAPRKASGWIIAASLMAGIGIGAGAVQIATPEQTWVDAVGSYQALYVPATLAGKVQPFATTQAVISAFEDEAGVSLDGVTEIEGLTFKRAQTLAIEGRRLLQLAYVTGDGTPVAYCLTQVDEKDRAPRSSVTFGLQAVDWVRDGTGFVLVGDLAPARLQSLQSSLPGA